jgi:ABC-type nitrate/sulfonate/bicarbonate transport system permease component
MKKWRRWILPLLPIAAFLVTWELAARYGLINSSLFPPPTAILRELVKLHTRRLPERSLLLTHIGASLQRVFIAATLGTLSGVLTGLLMGASRVIRRFLDPIITALMPIPGIAQAPLFIVWLGFGDPTIITVGAIAAFFPIAYNTAAGVRSIDPQLVRAARIMGAHPSTTLFKVYLPSAAGYVLAGLRLGWARCWRTVIAVEFVAAANWGLGYMIWDASEYIRTGVVYGGILLLMLIYFVIEKLLIGTTESLTVRRWGMIRS